MDDLALSMSMNRASWSVTPAMPSSSLTAALSAGVQVGDLKLTVSLRIAHSMAPAMFLGRSTLFFLNISRSIVQVQPMG